MAYAAVTEILVDIWVRKEHRNLSRLARWGLNVPRPIGIHKNVLVMEYLGTKIAASPKLREVTVENPEVVFDDLLEFLAICWQKASLVHGDFSPYNILWHDGCTRGNRCRSSGDQNTSEELKSS